MRRYRSVAAAVVCALASVLPAQADERLEALTERWYAIEAIVFHRVDTTPADSPEHLYRTEPRSVPAGIRAIAADAPGFAYDLDPLTRATLEFPTLSLNCPEAEDTSRPRTAGVPAWYQPVLLDDGGITDPAAKETPPGTASEFPGDAAPQPTANEDAHATGQPANKPTIPPRAGFPYNPCRPSGGEIDGSSESDPDADDADASRPGNATRENCPPVSFDVPVPPAQSRLLCGLPPGQPPPAISPRLEPHPLLDWLNAVRRFENELRGDSYRAITRGVRLRREANRIKNAGHLRLLWHGRWIQPAPPRNAPEPLLIQAGRRDRGVHELEGTFDITLGRYLHFRAHLWWVSPPVPRTVAATDPSSTPEGARSRPDSPPSEGIEYMVLRESRAMRSGTLHYLDHPVLGILVRADPVAAPRWLVEALARISHQLPAADADVSRLRGLPSFDTEQGGD